MKLRTPILLITALLSFTGARAQSTAPPNTPAAPPPAQPQAKPHDPLDDDPLFKSLPPEPQEWVRKVMQSINQQLDAKPGAPPPAIPPLPPVKPAPAAPQAQPAQSPQTGCATTPVKPPKFHIPKAMQDAINKQAKQVGKQTGVDLDPNAPAQAVKDAQKAAPCPPAPAPVPAQKPANQ